MQLYAASIVYAFSRFHVSHKAGGAAFDEYRQRYSAIKMTRDEAGILTMTLHTDGGSLQFGSDDGDRYQIADAFLEIANDPLNKVVVITGTGEEFSGGPAKGLYERYHDPMSWDVIYRKRRRLLLNLMEIEAPIIVAVNGPARVHAELTGLCDIVLVSETACFEDAGHFPRGGTPGDGAHIIWPHLLGPIRGKFFLLTGQSIGAEEAVRVGIANEMLPPEVLLDRAMELAEMIAARPALTVRYTRAVMNLALRRLLHNDLGYGLALEGLAAVQLRGWRMHMGGSPPEWDH
jgi:enoyl-CoA hydratase/carnithine racemase